MEAGGGPELGRLAGGEQDDELVTDTDDVGVGGDRRVAAAGRDREAISRPGDEGRAVAAGDLDGGVDVLGAGAAAGAGAS